MGKVHQAASYLKYLFRSRTRYRVHSPFIYRFVERVLRDRTKQPDLQRLLDFRRELLNDRTPVIKKDFGAGRRSGSEYRISTGRLVQNSSGNQECLRLLYKMGQYFKPGTVVELGTSLGFSAMAIALADPGAKIYTIEGSPGVAAKAEDNIGRMGIENIVLLSGEFREQLPALLKKVSAVDMAFIDGDHRKSSTLEYFELLLQKRSEQAVFVLDDIHWSKGMEEAWEEICSHPESKVTLDIYSKGIVFFRPGLTSQHYILRY